MNNVVNNDIIDGILIGKRGNRYCFMEGCRDCVRNGPLSMGLKNNCRTFHPSN